MVHRGAGADFNVGNLPPVSRGNITYTIVHHPMIVVLRQRVGKKRGCADIVYTLFIILTVVGKIYPLGVTIGGGSREAVQLIIPGPVFFIDQNCKNSRSRSTTVMLTKNWDAVRFPLT